LPFWNVVLMAAHDETMAFILWLWYCVWCKSILEGRMQRRAPLLVLGCLFKHRNENDKTNNSNENRQENGLCKQKYLSLIWK
jgi:hypothetical protein